MAALLAAAPGLTAQSGSASLEFTVRATPTGGRAEKVIQHPFYLLRASLEEIEAIARQEVPPPELAAFVDGLSVSPELKEWMKRRETMTLRGDEFLTALSIDDILAVPEFRDAYQANNLIVSGFGFPKRSAKPSDKEKNPGKWEKSEKRYWEEVRNYLSAHPESKLGMDEHLRGITASTEWSARQQRYQQEVRQRVLQLVHSRFLAARTETDYEGVAHVRGLAPGRYWLTNLWNEVRAGDMHLTWEVPVELRAGETRSLELNNANARFVPRPR